jgi:tetratricopeptide (TPR) repeat protein
MTGDTYLRLDLLLSLRRFREAEKLARECLAGEPDSDKWHAQLARALVGQERIAEALDAGRTAAGLAPGNPQVLALLAWVLIHADRPGDALEVLRDVLRLNPLYPWGHQLLASAYAQVGRSAEQLAAARRAVALAPEGESSWIQLGWALYAGNQFEEAIQAADSGLRLRPDSAHLHNLRGACLTDLAYKTWRPRRFQTFREAHHSLREALRLDPGDPDNAANLIRNAVEWRLAVYRVVVWAGLGLLCAVGVAVGYPLVGDEAFAVPILIGSIAFILRGPLFTPPGYGLLVLPLERLGIPDVPMTPKDRVWGRLGLLYGVVLIAALLFVFTLIIAGNARLLSPRR